MFVFIAVHIDEVGVIRRSCKKNKENSTIIITITVRYIVLLLIISKTSQNLIEIEYIARLNQLFDFLMHFESMKNMNSSHHFFKNLCIIHAELSTNNDEYDIVIIGTGVSGVACTHWLRQLYSVEHFPRICLFEKSARPCSDVSSLNTVFLPTL